MNEGIFDKIRLRQMAASEWAKGTLVLDALFFVAGWESRASYLSQSVSLLTEQVFAIKFKSTNSGFDKRKSEVLKNIKGSSDSVRLLRFNRTAEFSTNCERFMSEIGGLYRRAGRPLRIGIDVSCLPKMYISFLIAFLFKESLCSLLVCFYSEGVYKQIGGSRRTPTNRFKFSAGDWEPVEVPFLESSLLSDENRNLIISLGAELRQARAHAVRFEPVQTAVIGVQNDPQRLDLKSVADSAGMDEYFDTVRNNGGWAGVLELQDIVGVARRADEIIHGFNSGVTRIFAVGCKPHTIALSVVAMGREDVELVCRLPGAYANHDALPNGPIWAFEISDKFEPLAYLRA